MNQRTIGYYIILCVTVMVLLFVGLRFWQTQLQIPITYGGDGLFQSVISKALGEESFIWTFHNLGSPFQLDFIDFAFAQFVDFFEIKILRSLGFSFGTSINIFWFLSIISSALLCAWTFRQLKIRWIPTFVLSCSYALIPWVFYRNIAHLAYHLTFIPVTGYWLYLIASGEDKLCGSKTQLFVYIMLFLLGLNNTYFAFFTFIILAYVLLYRWQSDHKRFRSLCWTSVAVGGGAFCSLFPSIVYWLRNGRSFATAFKYPAEADIYAIKLRHLLEPIPQHPFAPLRKISHTFASANFPLENENSSGRLGFIGALGVLFLLAYLLKLVKVEENLKKSLSILSRFVAFILLVAMVGGFGGWFNTFISPQIRAYNRMAVFLGYFAFLALGLVWTTYYKQFSNRVHIVFAAFIIAWIPIDQIPTKYFTDTYALSKSQFYEDKRFVERIEESTGEYSMIFQLPFAEFFGDGQDLNKMGPYDSARLFLHSKNTRWSWGAAGHRDRGWYRETSHLPVHLLLERVVWAGFTGITIDTYGYRDDLIIREIKSILGDALVTSEQERYLYFGLSTYREKLMSNIDESKKFIRKEKALYPLLIEYKRGVYNQEQDAKEVWRWCNKDSELEIKNPSTLVRKVHLDLTVENPHPKNNSEFNVSLPDGRVVTISFKDREQLKFDFTLLPSTNGTIRMRTEGERVYSQLDPRPMYFRLLEAKVRED